MAQLFTLLLCEWKPGEPIYSGNQKGKTLGFKNSRKSHGCNDSMRLGRPGGAGANIFNICEFQGLWTPPEFSPENNQVDH